MTLGGKPPVQLAPIRCGPCVLPLCCSGYSCKTVRLRVTLIVCWFFWCDRPVRGIVPAGCCCGCQDNGRQTRLQQGTHLFCSLCISGLVRHVCSLGTLYGGSRNRQQSGAALGFLLAAKLLALVSWAFAKHPLAVAARPQTFHARLQWLPCSVGRLIGAGCSACMISCIVVLFGASLASLRQAAMPCLWGCWSSKCTHHPRIVQEERQVRTCTRAHAVSYVCLGAGLWHLSPTCPTCCSQFWLVCRLRTEVWDAACWVLPS